MEAESKRIALLTKLFAPEPIPLAAPRHRTAGAVGLQGGVSERINGHTPGEILEGRLNAAEFDIAPLVAGEPNPLLTRSRGGAGTGVQDPFRDGHWLSSHFPDPR